MYLVNFWRTQWTFGGHELIKVCNERTNGETTKRTQYKKNYSDENALLNPGLIIFHPKSDERPIQLTFAFCNNLWFSIKKNKPYQNV